MANEAPAQASLDTAPALNGSAAQPAPLAPHYRAEFLIETANGFHVLIAGEGLIPRDLMAFLKTTDENLHKGGFKPVRRDTAINVEVTAPAAPAASAPPATTYAGTVYTECPTCGGPVYDNRAKKVSGAMKPNAPFFKCQDPSCDWAEWPRRGRAK